VLQKDIPGAFCLEDLIQAARANPRPQVGDDEVREALKLELLPLECLGYRVVDELGICEGTARVDIAAIGPAEISGYEIKSELDTLRRLARQSDAFGTVFDRMTLVVASHHAAKARSLVPDWWGIIEVHRGDARINFSRVRDSNRNPKPDVGATLSLLRVSELAQVALQAGIRVRGSRKADVIGQLSGQCDANELRVTVTSLLRSRTQWRTGSPRT